MSRAASRAKWIAANPERMDTARERWRRANWPKVQEYRRRSKKANPLANRGHIAAAKARELGVPIVRFSPDQLRARLEYFGNRCWICGADGETLDHVKPMSHGGAHMLSNIRPACLSCNSSKNNQWPYERSA